MSPAVLLILGLVADVVRARWLKPDAAPAVPVGQAVPVASDEWAERAYAGVVAQLADEAADHEAEKARHHACDDLLRALGVDVPHD